MRQLFLCASALFVFACSDSASPTDATSSGSGGQTGSSVSGPGATSGTGGAGGDFSNEDPLAGAPAVELVKGGFGFTEGPCWFASLGVLRFSDQNAGLYELAGDVVSPWSLAALPNGNAIAPNGDMITCFPGKRDVERGPADAPNFTSIASTYMGLKHNAPNDVIVRSDGNVYFTDPDYGLAAQDHELGFNGVFRIAPGGAETLITSALAMPNGIALSPDEKHLYVADEPNAQLYRFDVHDDGAADNGMLFITTSPHPDGMAVDDAGNLYLATESGIDVRKPDGTAWGIVPVAEQPANCTFGGANRRTLFITARTGLYRVHLNVPGKP